MNSVQADQYSNGYLELIVGPMFSGKTSHLINLYKQYELSGMKVCCINYKNDTRYDPSGNITSHDNRTIPSINIITLSELQQQANYFDYDVYLINEGQFFGDLFEHVIDLVDNKRKIVHVCGLNGDFQRDNFGPLYKLYPMCDNIVMLKSICKICKNGTRAIFSKRIDASNTQIEVIGNEDSYIPVCRKCYLMK